MSKQFWAVIVIIALIFVGIIFVNGNKNKTSSGSKNSTAQATQHITGKGSTGVTLVEYGDYECPYCEEYYPVVKQVVQEYNDRIFYQFRNFPLTSVHVNAFAAARAAEAAGLQGKFWEMHDALYSPNNWQVWSTSSDPTPYFNQYAQQLGLNIDQFKADFGSSKVNDAINADMAAGNKLGIQGTPTFFINGKQVTIAGTVADFEKALNAAIAQQAKTH